MPHSVEVEKIDCAWVGVVLISKYPCHRCAIETQFTMAAQITLNFSV
jgi:hypothetical protein